MTFKIELDGGFTAGTCEPLVDLLTALKTVVKELCNMIDIDRHAKHPHHATKEELSYIIMQEILPYVAKTSEVLVASANPRYLEPLHPHIDCYSEI